MILLVLAAVLLAVVLGGRRFGAGLRGVLNVWRPAAGLAAVATMIAALALVTREDWFPAAAFCALSIGLAIGARKRRRLSGASTAGASLTPEPGGPMSPAEARAILGLEADAGPEAVQAAYRRLIRMAHPDQGGTRGLAAQLNLARDVLLGR